MTSPYFLIEDNIAEGGIGVKDAPFKNIMPGGYVRSGLARMRISSYTKLSGDSRFLQKLPWEQFPFVLFLKRVATYNMANYWVTSCPGAREHGS